MEFGGRLRVWGGPGKSTKCFGLALGVTNFASEQASNKAPSFVNQVNKKCLMVVSKSSVVVSNTSSLRCWLLLFDCPFEATCNLAKGNQVVPLHLIGHVNSQQDDWEPLGSPRKK